LRDASPACESSFWRGRRSDHLIGQLGGGGYAETVASWNLGSSTHLGILIGVRVVEIDDVAGGSVDDAFVATWRCLISFNITDRRGRTKDARHLGRVGGHEHSPVGSRASVPMNMSPPPSPTMVTLFIG